MIGLAVGMVRFVLEFVYTAPSCASKLIDTRPWLIQNVHYLHFGLFLFFVVLISCIIISLMTPPIDSKHLYRLTYWTKYSDKARVNIGDPLYNQATQDGAYNKAFNSYENNNDLILEGMEGYGARSHQTQPRPAQMDMIETTGPEQRSAMAKVIYTMCCMGKELEEEGKTSYDVASTEIDEKLTRDDEAKFAATLALEDDMPALICNSNAIFLLVVASFFWGVYA